MISVDKPSASCLIAGGGPAGLAPLVAAAHQGNLQELLDAGVVIVERSDEIGSGEIGRYSINSDSAAEAFLDAVMRTKEPGLAALRTHPTVASIVRYTGGSIPLELAAAYLKLIGETLCELVNASPRGLVLKQHHVISTQALASGAWMTRVRSELTGWEQTIVSASVVMATGAHQPESRLRSEKVAGVSLLPSYAAKLLQSGYVLTRAGLAEIVERLSTESDPRIVVVGGSTSAGAVTRVLLNECPELKFGPERVTLMHRQPLRIFYNSAAEALEDGYTDFGPRDICNISGRVYRLAGFRFETRELMMRALHVAGRLGEPRLRLHRLEDGNALQTGQLLDEAHVIVAALGYRPRGIPAFAQDGSAIALNATCDAMKPLVDDSCHVLTQANDPVRGLYGIGLASGFVSRGEIGGEESFQGQSNSLWLWQHDIGARVVAGIMEDYNEHLEYLAVQQGCYRMSMEMREEACYAAKL